MRSRSAWLEIQVGLVNATTLISITKFPSRPNDRTGAPTTTNERFLFPSKKGLPQRIFTKRRRGRFFTPTLLSRAAWSITSARTTSSMSHATMRDEKAPSPQHGLGQAYDNTPATMCGRQARLRAAGKMPNCCAKKSTPDKVRGRYIVPLFARQLLYAIGLSSPLQRSLSQHPCSGPHRIEFAACSPLVIRHDFNSTLDDELSAGASA